MDLPFFKKHVTNWNKNKSYKTCKTLTTSVKVVNAVAKSGIALMDEYNKLHTKDEAQNQYFKNVIKASQSISLFILCSRKAQASLDNLDLTKIKCIHFTYTVVSVTFNVLLVAEQIISSVPY